MIQIAIIGFGTVGTGVAKVISENADEIEKKLGEPLHLKRILVRRFQDGAYRQLMTNDFAEIENDPEIRVVVETIGGVDAAYAYTKRALCAGKHVVTANKQLIAEYGCELLVLAREKHVHYLFEASVGGGIPILHPLVQCLSANRIDEIYGILNGTTNYILSRMEHAEVPFQAALLEAQEKGYAEADPTADVEGIDAGRKTCILADLAFAFQVNPNQIPIEGISKLTLEDMEIVKRAGYRLKLLGRAVRLPGEKRTAYVAPHLVPEKNPISNVEDVFNAVMIRGNAVGEVMFYGQGAGEMPTASACVSDIIEALVKPFSQRGICWDANSGGFVDPDVLYSRYYFRIRGTLREAVAAFDAVEVLTENDEMTASLTDEISGKQSRTSAQVLSVQACFRVLA